MLLDATYQDALYDFFASALGGGVTVIWANQGANVPARPFVTLFLSGLRSMGRPPASYISEDVYEYRFQRQFTLTVNVFAQTNYLGYMHNILTALSLPSKRALLRAVGLAINTVFDVIDLTDLLETDMEQRASLDVNMSYGVDVQDTVGEIQTVELTGVDSLEPLGLITVP